MNRRRRHRRDVLRAGLVGLAGGLAGCAGSDDGAGGGGDGGAGNADHDGSDPQESDDGEDDGSSTESRRGPSAVPSGAETESARLVAPDQRRRDALGVGVALAGSDTALVGAPGRDAALVFERADGSWNRTGTLSRSVREDDIVGHTVALSGSGDTALLGGMVDSEPAGTSIHRRPTAHVFDRTDGGWTRAAELAAGDVDGEEYEGTVDLSADGTTALVCANDPVIADEPWGAFVFERAGATWQRYELLPEPPYELELYGVAGALDAEGTTALVADSAGLRQRVYVFERDADGWTPAGELQRDDEGDPDVFGGSVALSADGTLALVGAARQRDSDTDGGAAYVFARADGSWTQEAKLVPTDGARGVDFGEAVAFSGGEALVGAPRHDAPDGLDEGVVYTFERDGGDWTSRLLLAASDRRPDDRFGESLAATGSRALVGARGRDGQNVEDAGAAYVFEL